MDIRAAKQNDVPAILEIYNHAVLHTTATFDLKEKTVEEMNKWFEKYNDRYPLIVATMDGKVVGYCSLSPFREKEAYGRTVELSVYVHENARGKGIARQLIMNIIKLGKQANHHVIIAGITAGNDVSVHLHESFGFTFVGCFRGVGFKFEKWQDVLFYQLTL
ncbi:N-acetyltransferase [Bacillus sp. 165]|nr:N-acetyltransferase [Bacillus sp. 165]